MKSWIRTALLSLDTLLLIIVGGVAVYALITVREAKQEIATLHINLALTKNELATQLASTTAHVDEVEVRHIALSDLFYSEQKRVGDLADNINGFDRTVGRLSGSVETLKKLTTTDPELLQKYSRVYFLNENYKPSDLTVIEEKYDLKNGKEVTVQSDMGPFLKDLLDDAWENGVELMVLSGYRSFAEQSTLKQNYTQRYGTGANQFSADQGYSEHQLGTTVDFTNTTIGEAIDDFEQTKSFAWLNENAYKYGFVMSYPKGNEYYMYEPWHWRFVGKDLAKYLHRNEKLFYNMEQREIDAYIPKLFDN
ncbi:MAG: M15 family metallopeptidase [Candidatus Pacebacteria bacterium]|nr:M15 family metallopeptidase [Candidatus Paceibacterota bacterium]